ncbi:Uncharacterised protein [Achromobacter xylosoxidans]|nr:Uncharacterised protein [Achromobacter xylosoxidans]
MPCSATVGTAGSKGERCGDVTASARRRPAAIKGAALDAVTTPMPTWPDITSVRAGPQPL